MGYFDDNLGHAHDFIESGGAYPTFDATSSNARTTKAFGINDAGDIVGTYQLTEVVDGVAGSTINNGFYATPLAAAAPEPSTWAMLPIGFAGLSLAGWRAPRTQAASATS